MNVETNIPIDKCMKAWNCRNAEMISLMDNFAG